MIGQIIGHYKIVEKLGAGGMGEVYRADDSTLKRQVALKVLPPDLAASQERLERFQREAESLAALNHPNIVMIHTVEEAEGVRFLTMELVEGRQLSALIPKGGMPLERIFEIAVPLADALAAAHERGVIHRDLKPGNIMVTAEGRVKVLDFGLAKLVVDAADVVDTEMPTEPLTDEGRILGTIPYMSPEQLDGHPVDARTDIFSLGVILYELATGERPFKGDKSASVISAIMRDDPEDVDAVRQDLPHHLGRIISHCLEKDRERRYQSAKDVRNELEALRKEVETGPTTSGVTLAARPRRTRLPTRTAALFAVVALILLGLWIVSKEESATPPKVTEGDVLVLTDFTNTTGDPVFDGTLKQALAVKLRESPYLHLLPEREVQATLRLMNRSTEEKVTPEIGQEICERRGIKAMVKGTISSLGDNYVITLEAVNCQTGESLAARQFEISSKEEVLSAVGQGAVDIRRELGESLASIERYDAPIEDATTSSLEALKAMAMGDRTRIQATEEKAIPFYKRALELDPDFAFAHARLGNAYANMREYDNAVYHKSKAYELREEVSERERLYITGHYHGTVTGDLNKLIETYELFKQAYPRISVAANNLCSEFEAYGMFERALEECELAMSLDSDAPLHYINMANVLRDLGRLDESIRVVDEAFAEGFTRSSLLNFRFLSAYIDGDRATMDRMLEAMVGVPGESEILFSNAEGVAASGRLEEANRLNRRAIDTAKGYGFNERAADLLVRSAFWDASFGLLDESAAKTQEALGIAHSRESVVAGAIVFATAGQSADAHTLIQQVINRYPGTDTEIYSVWLPIARAAVSVQNDDGTTAIEELESVRPYERAFLIAIYLRGQAYLMLDQPDQAKGEFEKILDLRGVNPTHPVHTLVHLQLGRALAQGGETTAALESYKTFLAKVAEADPGLPVVEEARQESGELTSSV